MSDVPCTYSCTPTYFSLVHHTNINKLTKSIHFIHYHVISDNLYPHNTGFDEIAIHACIPNFYVFKLLFRNSSMDYI